MQIFSSFGGGLEKHTNIYRDIQIYREVIIKNITYQLEACILKVGDKTGKPVGVSMYSMNGDGFLKFLKRAINAKGSTNSTTN